jgi:hypothetical protein
MPLRKNYTFSNILQKVKSYFFANIYQSPFDFEILKPPIAQSIFNLHHFMMYIGVLHIIPFWNFKKTQTEVEFYFYKKMSKIDLFMCTCMIRFRKGLLVGVNDHRQIFSNNSIRVSKMQNLMLIFKS